MSSTQQRAVISFFVIMVTVLVVAGALAIKPSKQTSTISSTTTPSTSVSSADRTTTGSSTSPVTSVYKDGIYQTTGSYSTPEGIESIGVSITLHDDVVSASTVTDQSRSDESRFYNENFIGSYQSFVVGKKLDDIQLGIVAGASLTPNGFNQALESIKQQAQS